MADEEIKQIIMKTGGAVMCGSPAFVVCALPARWQAAQRLSAVAPGQAFTREKQECAKRRVSRNQSADDPNKPLRAKSLE